MLTLTSERKHTLQRRIRWIVAATIAYNVIEAIVAITAGAIASSAALLGFGLDSIVEVLSAAAVAWQFASPTPERRERAALKTIAISFFGLAVFVSIDATRSLLGFTSPEHSTVGIILAASSVMIMPIASWLERSTGQELGSASAIADSKQTLICSYLSGQSSWDSCSTLGSAGLGPMQSQPSSSQRSQSARDSKPGEATPANSPSPPSPTTDQRPASVASRLASLVRRAGGLQQGWWVESASIPCHPY